VRVPERRADQRQCGDEGECWCLCRGEKTGGRKAFEVSVEMEEKAGMKASPLLLFWR